MYLQQSKTFGRIEDFLKAEGCGESSSCSAGVGNAELFSAKFRGSVAVRVVHQSIERLVCPLPEHHSRCRPVDSIYENQFLDNAYKKT